MIKRYTTITYQAKVLENKLSIRFNIKVLSLLFVFIFSLPIEALFSQNENSDSKSPVLTDIRQKLEEGTVFKAEFNHWSADTFTGDTTRYQGDIWITKNRYKVVANSRIIVVKDSISRVHDQNRNRVIISKYDPNEDEFAPARLMYRTPEQYKISEAREQETIIVELKASDPFAYFKSITLKVASQSKLPQNVKAVDQTDNELMTSFSSGRFMTTVPDGLFDFEYSDDAEVIDLRKE